MQSWENNGMRTITDYAAMRGGELRRAHPATSTIHVIKFAFPPFILTHHLLCPSFLLRYFFSASVHLSSHRALKTNHKAFWAAKYIFNRPFPKKRKKKSFGNRPTKLSRQAPSCPRGLHFLPGPPLYQRTDLNSAVKTLLLRFFPSTRILPNSAMKSYYLHASPHPISSYNCLVVSRQGGLHIDQPNSHLISLLTYLLRFINWPIK